MFLSLFNQDLVGLWLHGHSSLLLGGGETGGAWNRFFGRCHPEELQNLRTHQSLGRCGLPVKTLNIGPDMTYIWYPFEGLLCGVVVSTWLLHGIGHTDGSNFKDTPHAHLQHLLQPPKKGVCVQGHVQTLKAGGVSTANILAHLWLFWWFDLFVFF